MVEGDVVIHRELNLNKFFYLKSITLAQIEVEILFVFVILSLSKGKNKKIATNSWKKLQTKTPTSIEIGVFYFTTPYVYRISNIVPRTY
jgi:hypothetical protein